MPFIQSCTSAKSHSQEPGHEAAFFGAPSHALSSSTYKSTSQTTGQMFKSFWINLPMLSDTCGFALLMLPMIVNVCGRTLMDKWHFPLLGELCAPMDNKNKSDQHDCISEKGWQNREQPIRSIWSTKLCPRGLIFAYPWFCFHGSKDCLSYSKAI